MKFKTLAIAFAILACVSICKADIASYDCADDGDGVVTCPPENVSWEEVGGEYNMTMTGSHNEWAYGHIVGWFETGEDPDPTVKLTTSIDNDTGNGWTDYHVNIYMDNAFTIVPSSAFVNVPNDWTYAITAVVPGSFFDADLNPHAYKGSIDYYAGTTVGVGDTLEFGYKINFTGTLSFTRYGFTQEMLPTPEPGTLVLLGCGLLGLLAVRRRFV